MGIRAWRWALAGAVTALLVGGASACVFDPSGRPYDNSNTTQGNNNTENNNNAASPVCGDGVIEAAEACDDANAAGGDGCGADCQPEAGWVCIGEPSLCEQTCGNGGREAGEACDDGNVVEGDGCDAQCQVEPGWNCDTPPCVPVCGDGLVVGAEGCDDGNTVAGDGCDADCAVEPFSACAGQPSVCHCVVYVNLAAVPQPRTGATWSEALATVQQGITAASAGCQVWVAAGVYHIRQGSDDDTVSLKQGVAVYGGFVGSETQTDQRNWVLNPTVLDGANSAQSERAYHVVTADGVNGAILSGFTVTRGNAKWGRNGGGIFVSGSNVVLSQLRVEDNTADINGGGIHLWDSTVDLSRSIVMGNDANDGGGVSVDHNSELTAARCRFVGNVAEYHGGGLRVFDFSAATVTSSLLVDNEAVYNHGGAIINWSFTDLTLIHCTIYRNHAGTAAGAIRNLSADTCTVRNSILWGNTPDAFEDANTTAVLSHTIMQDSGWAGSGGNLGSDPLLVSPGFTLDPLSPAIDTADDAFAEPMDLAGSAPVDIPNVGTPGTLADRGCFEHTP